MKNFHNVIQSNGQDYVELEVLTIRLAHTLEASRFLSST